MFAIKSCNGSGHTLTDESGNRMVYSTKEEAELKAAQLKQPTMVVPVQ